MGKDHLEVLSKAMAKLIDDRRAFAAKLAGPGEPEERERWRPMFIQIQETIEAMDRAIKDELQLSQPGAASGNRPRQEIGELANATPYY